MNSLAIVLRYNAASSLFFGVAFAVAPVWISGLIGNLTSRRRRLAVASMLRDKQLRDVKLEKIVEKRRLNQALGAKEYAVLAGISYSTAHD